MNLKPLIATAIIALFIGAFATYAILEYYHQMTATVTSIKLTRNINGTILTDNEPIDWGIVENGTTTTLGNLTVTNNGTKQCTIYLWHDAPNGWTVTWDANASVLEPNQNCTAPLELYVAANATQGMTYNWDCYVRAE